MREAQKSANLKERLIPLRNTQQYQFFQCFAITLVRNDSGIVYSGVYHYGVMMCNSLTRQLDLVISGEGMVTGVAQGMLFDCFALRYAALRSRTVFIVPVQKAWTFSTQR